MACLKCGRETEQSFCEECRADMSKHPVKPGIAVQLPHRDPIAKKIRRVQISPETIIVRQKKTIRILSGVIAVLSVLLIGLSVFTVYRMKKQEKPALGQNYSAVTDMEQTTVN